MSLPILILLPHFVCSLSPLLHQIVYQHHCQINSCQIYHNSLPVFHNQHHSVTLTLTTSSTPHGSKSTCTSSILFASSLMPEICPLPLQYTPKRPQSAFLGGPSSLEFRNHKPANPSPSQIPSSTLSVSTPHPPKPQYLSLTRFQKRNQFFKPI